MKREDFENNLAKVIAFIIVLIIAALCSAMVSATIVLVWPEYKAEETQTLQETSVEIQQVTTKPAQQKQEQTIIATTHEATTTTQPTETTTKHIAVTTKSEVATTTQTTTATQKVHSLGVFKLTAYCPCSKCCGSYADNRPTDKDGNPIVYTASGAVAQEGVTIAADTRRLPFKTKVKINGHTYTVQDRGGAIKGNRIDIYFANHQAASDFGVRYAEVVAI